MKSKVLAIPNDYFKMYIIMQIESMKSSWAKLHLPDCIIWIDFFFATMVTTPRMSVKGHHNCTSKTMEL